MAEVVQNSYLQRYELKQLTHSSRSLGKPKPSSPSPDIIEANSIGAAVGRLTERVDGIEVKLTSLINVVRLVQRYTETRDDQYEKERESELHRPPTSQHQANYAQLDQRIKEYQTLNRQVRDQMRQIQQLRATCTFAPARLAEQEDSDEQEGQGLRELEKRMRSQLDKKMEVCVNLITSNLEGREGRLLSDKVNEVSFSLNQLENECRRNKMMFEKELDTLAALIKETSTQIPAYSRLTEQQLPSKSPPKPLSKNARSEKSISKGKQNRSALIINHPKDSTKVRDEELREALRKKKQHRDKLKVKNW